MTNKSFLLITLDDKGSDKDHGLREIDRREFIGSTAEAMEELRLEYDEFFPSTSRLMKTQLMGHPNHRSEDYWAQRFKELIASKRTRVEGCDMRKRETKFFELSEVI